MSRFLAGCAGALMVSATLVAQDPPPRQDPTTRPPAAQQDKAVTVEGCLVREADVPGRKPNVAERAGIAEDYILTSAKVIKGSAPAGYGAARPGETPTGTSGMAGAMYEVGGIDDEKLKQHVGQRVQIEGTVESLDRAKAPKEGQTPADDLVEIRGTVIRKVAGNCPAVK
jgi:hypothetical protein